MAGVPLKSLNGPSAGCCVGYTQSWVGPSKELYSVFPPIWLFPKVDRQLTTEGIYCCPVYKTLLRAGLLSTTGHSTNFVLPVELPSLEPCSGLFHKYVETFSGHWIKRAVALFCALNY